MSLPNGIQSTQALLDAQSHVWNHIFSFINSMSLKCAMQLGIPDIIHDHGKPITLPELIDALPINKEKSLFVQRLMRILIHSKFFATVKISEKDDEEGYWLTPSSLLLLRDEPLSMMSFVLIILDPMWIDPWHRMGEWFKAGDVTPFETTHGRTLWEAAGQNPAFNQFFNEAIASDARLVASVIVKDLRQVFEGLRSIVDVGGGTGTVARALANAFPGLNCTVFDLPHVVAGLEGTKNLSFVAGDMFEAIPPADAVFMKWIMHDWPDEECIKILKNCKEAIFPSKDKGGKVVVVDMVLYDRKEHEATETQLLMDMEVMMLNSGKERTAEEWAKLFCDAGFMGGYKITPMLGLRSLIEVFP